MRTLIAKVFRHVRSANVPPASLLSYPASASELAVRRQAWLHLSDLWLDTETDRDLLAGALAKLPYSLEQLEEICVFEVGPQVYSNLESIAGEWLGFDPDWLERRILASLKSPHGRRKAWRKRARTLRIAGGDWEGIKTRISMIRAGSGRTPGTLLT